MKEDGQATPTSRRKGQRPATAEAHQSTTTKDVGNSGVQIDGNLVVGSHATVQVAGEGGHNEINHHYHGRFSPAEIRKAYARYIRAECDRVWQPGNGCSNRKLLEVYAAMRAVPTEFGVETGSGPWNQSDPVQLRAFDPSDEGKADQERGETEENHGQGKPVARGRIRIGPVLDLAAAVDRLVLLGPPGGGKSTFLRHLALKLANQWDPGADAGAGGADQPSSSPVLPAAFEDFVPVWIELRKLRWTTSASGSHLPRLLAAHWAELGTRSDVWEPDEWVEVKRFLRGKLDEGKLLFLLDGLDEVTRIVSHPEEEEKLGTDIMPDLFGLHEAILEIADWRPSGRDCSDDQVPFNRMIVTCRGTSWRDGWRITGWVDQPVNQPWPAPRRGMVASLELMGEAERLAFLSGWFRNAEKARQIHGFLTDPDRDWNGRLSEMASVPLNLTMIAWLAQKRLVAALRDKETMERALPLPATRAAIYEQVVHAILWEIDDEKELKEPGHKTLSALVGRRPERRGQFVQWLAYVAHESLRGRALNYLWLKDSYARAMHGDRFQRFGDQAAGVLDTMQCRAGILRLENPGKGLEAGGGVYEFVHRSFCEYLAALYFIQGPVQSDGKRLKDRALAWLDNWIGSAHELREIRERTWEPLRLAAGYLGVAGGDRQALLPGGREIRPVEGLELLIRALLEFGARGFRERSNSHAQAMDGYIWLAGELALQAGTVSEDCLGPLREALVATMQSEHLEEPQRAEVGRVLGHLGDRRPGVAPKKSPGGAVPFFAWSTVFQKGRRFTMGGDSHSWQGHHPVERSIRDDYRVALYPVTNSQYDHFESSPYFETMAKAVGWKKRTKSNSSVTVPNQPAVNVRWEEAMGFCIWINSLNLSPGDLGIPDALPGERWELRLPSEAEWELAARGPEGRWLPWVPRARGRDNDASVPKAKTDELTGHCNWHGSGIRSTSAVGMYPSGKSWCGAEDMIGNVWEWTRTPWKSRPNDREEEEGREDSGNDRRVLRGGAWISRTPERLRCATRDDGGPGDSVDFVGFRVVCVRVSAACR